MRLELISERAAFDRLAESWGALLSEDCTAPAGMDATNTFEWASSLLDTFLAGAEWFVAVARDSAGVAGLLPVYRPSPGRGPFATRFLAVFSELYGGRNGFLVRRGDASVLGKLVDCLQQEVPEWDALRVRVVGGSRSEKMLGDLTAQAAFATRDAAAETSPILTMPDALEAWISSMKPSFRTELRRRERRLREAGALGFELFTDPADVSRFWDAVTTIERQSWKQAAGTSINCRPEQDRFYRAMLPRAAESGQWLSALLSLDGRPIAYRLSIAHREVALGLKTSFVDDLRKYSPASVLQWVYLQHVHGLGIRCFDFSGNAEDHKMQWTTDTYGIRAVQIFRPNARASLARLRSGLVSTGRTFLRRG